ncbi:MAG TPA: phosphorylase [Desulfobacterales bacterium]|nr:phosphorylase [Desulfobacterales bacterium]
MSYLTPPESEEAVITPRRGGTEAPVASRTLMTFTRPDYFEVCRLAQAKGQARNFADCPVREGCWQGEAITLAGPVLGAPFAVVVLEKLLALGARIVIALGWCGSLRPEVTIGELVLPERAYSEEGTSAHYPGADLEPRPDLRLFQSLNEQLLQSAATFHTGQVWTTDAIYRETKYKVETYGARGMLAVEMEMSALFNVAQYRGAALAGLLVVSDELFSLKWRHGARQEVFQQSRRLAAAVALDALASFQPSAAAQKRGSRSFTGCV